MDNLSSRFKVEEKRHQKMASNVEDDLIDLDGRACISRVSLPDTDLEEQEHLLDVCPPKLEQKLSLTKEQKINREHSDDGDVLVTLGHDQSVAILKRIDVVSSDTIKRVRNITKNLEPFITTIPAPDSLENDIRHSADQLDGINGSLGNKNESEESKFEAQAISAFDFLSEMDDYEDDNHADKIDDSKEFSKSIGSFIVSYPLEPKCLIKNSDERYNNIDKNNKDLDLSEMYPVMKSNNIGGLSEHDNLGFEISPPAKKPRLEVQVNERAKSVNFGIKENRVSGRQRRKDKKIQRKSWSEGGVCQTGSYSDGFERSTSYDIDYFCEPSTSGGASGVPVRKPDVPSGSSSDCSEVDWSWVEELEHERSTISRPTSEFSYRYAPTTLSSQLSSSSSAFTVADGSGNSGGRMRSNKQLATLSNGSVAMSVDATGKSLANCALGDNDESDQRDVASMTTTIDSSSLQCEEVTRLRTRDVNHGTSSPGGTSWVRASMRRLRHLRLPEADRSQRIPEIHSSNDSSSRPISAPNSLPDIALIAPEILAAHTNGTSGTVLRPSSAPVVRNVGSIIETPRRGRGNTRTRSSGCARRQSNTSRSSSRDNSVHSASDINSSGNSSASPASRSPQHQTTVTSPARRVCERRRGDAERENERSDEDDEDENPLGRWPHALSPALACLGCTLGLFNISRFAILSVHFGANFIVQFFVLSIVLGIPLLTLQVCLGQRLTAGAVDMWKISPIFHGVGIALLVAHAFIGIYSIIGISWMFVYFRDSFITKQDRYRWAEPFPDYRDDYKPMNSGIPYKLHETVPDYFSSAVLQRNHLNDSNPGVVTLKFQVAFNLAVVWMIVFVSLSKGLRSYGKVVYVFTLVPVSGTLLLCTKLLGLIPPGTIQEFFPATVWHEFFYNNKSWAAASSEVFLTWGLLGAASMQIAAHNKHKHLLQRDTSLVIVLTFVVLLLAAFLANTCVQILRLHGYIYTTSSFERIGAYVFMRPVNQPAASGQGITPERFMDHTSFLLGQRAIRPQADPSLESGYQAMRLSTELVPATLAILGTERVSPFWAVLFYFILILFGIAQQLAIWHCVITGIMAINTKMMKLWETTITFFSCACGYVLGLPMATEFGIYAVYYLDYTVGGGWWIMVLYLVQVGAVFAVRGRPHTGETVVAELFPPTGGCFRHWVGPLLSFTWNVILPITLMVLSITLFKSGNFRDLYVYKRARGEYWAVWARQLGAAIQLVPILIIPAVAIIQTCRYLNNGPPDIFDRIQMLYRPNLETEENRHAQTRYGNATSTSLHGNGILSTTSDIPFEDPPPKYTPPPSYTTATGARIAKMLRQSFRRSVRRIANVLGESSAPRARPALQPPPPDYATVLVEMNQTVLSRDITIHAIESRPDVTDTGTMTNTTERHRPNTIDRMTRINTLERCPVERTHSTIDRNRRLLGSTSSNLTAADVANLLRSSIRRGTSRTQQTLRSSMHSVPIAAASVENLVSAAAPIGEESLVFTKDIPLVHELNNDDDEDKKTVEIDNSVSVI